MDTEPVTVCVTEPLADKETEEEKEVVTVPERLTGGERDDEAEAVAPEEADADSLSKEVPEATEEGDAAEEADWEGVGDPVSVSVTVAVAGPEALAEAVPQGEADCDDDTVPEADSVAEPVQRALPVTAAMVRLGLKEPDAEAALEGERVRLPLVVPHAVAAALGESTSGVPVLLGLPPALALKEGVTVSVHDADSEAPPEAVRRTTVPVTRRLSDCDCDTVLLTEGVSQWDTGPVGDVEVDGVTVHDSLLGPVGDAEAEAVTEGEPVPLPPLGSPTPFAVSVAEVEGVELEEPCSVAVGASEALTEGDAEAVAVFVAVGLAKRVFVALTVMVAPKVMEPVPDSDGVTDREPEGDSVGVPTLVMVTRGEAVVEAEAVGELDAVAEGEPVVVPEKAPDAVEEAQEVELCE